MSGEALINDHASPSYIELHARSAFSFHRGASSPEELAAQAARFRLPAMALCERDGLYSAPRYYKAAREQGIRPILGAELTLEDQTILPVLVQSPKGYQNLSRLLTRSHLRNAKNQNRIQWSELPTCSEGLVCLTGDEEGPLRRALERRDPKTAARTLKCLRQTFGPDRVYVELQRHHRRGEEPILKQLVQLARKYRAPLLATNGVLYATPEGRQLLDVFTCLRHHTHLDSAGPWLSINAERHLKPASRMQRLFKDLPEAIANTTHLAAQLDFTLENLGYQFPHYPVASDDSMEAMLRREAYAGAQARFGKLSSKVRRQLEHELDLINRLGFAGYFLIVWDIVNFARSRQILVQGRGSAANSVVCYSLGITAVDPIRHRLLFERFLSEGRRSWPDIDLDFPSGERRETVIQEVYRRYAPYGAAMTANVITYRGRNAMREMGKALNLPTSVLDRFSSLFHSGDFPHTLDLARQIRQAGLPQEHPRLPALVSLYHQVYGLPRHLGQHTGGMVISHTGLDSVVPLENASMPGRIVVQWDKDDCEDLGIVKIDLLGLGMMSVIQDTLELCRQRGPDRTVELATIPQDDPPTYELMQKADTVGVFQIESRAQMATLPRMKPKTFYDLAIEVAIIRPGPIAGNLAHPYLNRRSGREPVTYMHPALEPVLERTLGVPLFQEQVLQIAMILAGFTGSEAEELRRALGFHKSPERMNKVLIKLRSALEKNRIAPHIQEEIIDSIRSFAHYGFPESHAISFALIAYASAWLKVHRAAEFYAALLNNQPMGFYSPDTLIKDAKRRGLRIRPVSVIESEERCTVEDDNTLRLGLNQVKGLSRASVDRILRQRRQKPWSDLADFTQRTQLPKDERRLLAEVGALNGLATHRRHALWEVEKPADPQDLFSDFSGPPPPEPPGPSDNDSSPVTSPNPDPLPSMSPLERMEADYRNLQLSVGRHPMAIIRPQIPKAWRAVDLPNGRNGRHVTIAGMVICRQRPGTAKGNLFISLEDETGIANAFVPSKTFEHHRLTITQEAFLLIEGPLQIENGVTSVFARSITPLPFDNLTPPMSRDFH